MTEKTDILSFIRQSNLNITLDDGSLHPVFPMTNKDDIMLNDPTLVINRVGLFKVIKNCVPSITSPEDIYIVDLVKILVGIRVSTNGNRYKTKNHIINLDNYLSKISDYETEKSNQELTFILKPITLSLITEIESVSKNVETIFNVVNSDKSDPEKIREFTKNFNKVSEVMMKTVVESIIEIKTNGTMITDKVHIKEFLTNCDTNIFNILKTHIDEQSMKFRLIKVELNGENFTIDPFTNDFLLGN